jgi:Domain of unknown function (DUF4136)
MTLRVIAVVSSLVLLPSLAAAQVRVDYDRGEDFNRFKTFKVTVGPLVGADGRVDEINTLAEDRLRRAVSAELSARGLEATDGNPDLIVRVSARNHERTELVTGALNSYPVFYRRYWYGRAYGYWGRQYYNDVWTRRFLEGAYTVDALDGDTGRLVYRAQVSDEIGRDLDKHVRKAIDQAFKKFPVKELAN